MVRQDNIYNRFPWLKITTTVENYIEPNYYERLLKDYVFNRKSDLEHFRQFLKNYQGGIGVKALELGCGNGRATQIFLDTVPYTRLDLVDLSPRMLRQTKTRLKDYKHIHYFRSDAIRHIETTNETYDLVFTLWSFSHSIHQLLSRIGLVRSQIRIRKAIERMVMKNMKKESRFFLIHFDSISDEQRILIRQWKKVFPIFRQNNIQSPSKLIIDDVLKNLNKQGVIRFSVRHYIGRVIEYTSIDEALEIFMNFHMESFFNKSVYAGRIIKELSAYFERFQRKNGHVYIKPGCFIYTFTKIK